MTEENLVPRPATSKSTAAWKVVLQPFTHAIGHGFRAEIDVADGERGYWYIWDLNGDQILETYARAGTWVTRTPRAGVSRGAHPSFDAAVAWHVRAIAATGGVQTEDLFWGRGDLRSIQLPRWTGEPDYAALNAAATEL